MNTSLHTIRGTIGALAVSAIVAGAAHAASTPQGMTPQEYRALVIRSQALNELYGGGAPAGMTPAEYRALKLRSQALNQLYGNALTRMSAPEFRATFLRSQALNDRYGKPDDPLTPAERQALRLRSEGLNALARSGVFAQPAVTSADGFDWGDFGIGVAAALGLVFVATGLAVGVRASRHPTAEARPS